MEECMKESMRKLALWYTRTFKPIMTHDELEPIMARLGFVGLPPAPSSAGGGGAIWKEYVFTAGARRRGEGPPVLPKPRLPYPRIDGLHKYTYSAFIDAVNFYLEMSDISVLFHIRGMPLHRIHDRSKKWRRMEEDENIFVYREGTLDQATYNFYHYNNKQMSSCTGKNQIRNKGTTSIPATSFVALKDIVE